MNGPLSGVKVVELSTFVAAPVCARLLADMGAEVIKIEVPQGDAWRYSGISVGAHRFSMEENPVFDLYNTGKKLISLNVKSAEGMEALHKLLAEADIFVTNVRPDALKRLGLSYEDLKEKYPQLIFAALLGYGEKGPEAKKSAFDTTTFWARSGFLRDMSPSENTYPVTAPYSVGDTATGYLLLAEILGALYNRTNTGKGQYVSSTLYHNGIFCMGTMVTITQKPFGTEYPRSRIQGGRGGCYECADGEWVYIAFGNIEKTLPKFNRIVGCPDLEESPKFKNAAERLEYLSKMHAYYKERFLTKTSHEWVKLAEEEDIPMARMSHFSEISEDEQKQIEDEIQKMTDKYIKEIDKACDAKEKDIMDVWFDSGSSHKGVLKVRDELVTPADLYLEGSDQHRGWFNSSLLTSVAVDGIAPYKAVLTHGFLVDEQGRKMSKSLGNGVDPLDVVNDMGADILRLWVSSADYRNDIAVSQGILKQVSEAYRKMRNTFRYLLGTVNDFNYNTDRVALADMEELDQWIMMKLHKLLEKVNKGYEDCEFHVVYHAVHNFCNVDLSAYYVDIVKDRLYCEEVDSKARRSCQSALYEILVALTQVMTPIISFTTEEVWKYLPKEDKELSVQLSGWPQVNPEAINDALEAKWDNILAVRGEVTKKLEEKRAAKEIGKALDAQVMLYADGEVYELLTQMADQLATIFIVSQVSVKPMSEAPADAYVSESVKGLAVEIAQAAGAICERCWIHSETLDENGLCPRCARVMATKAE